MNIDYSQYQSWREIVSPTGQHYYVIPGNEGYVYDPFLSSQKGRPVIWQNPESAVKEKEKAEAQAKAQASPLNQAAPALMGTAGTVGGMYAVNSLTPAHAVGQLANGSILMSDGTIKGAEAAAQMGSQAGTTALGQAAAEGALGAQSAGVSGIGPVASGEEYAASLGEAPGMMSAVSPYLGAAGAGLGAYGIFNATQMNDKRKAAAAGALSGAGMGLGAGMALPLLGFGPLGWEALGLMALGGMGLGGGLGGLMAHKSTKEIQAERWGAAGHPELAGPKDYFAGTAGEENRDERYLTPDAIRVNPDNYNNIPDWDSWTKANQDKFLQTMLDRGLVREKKGGIYYDDAQAKIISEAIRNGQELPPGPNTPQASTTALAAKTAPMSPAKTPTVIPAPAPTGTGQALDPGRLKAPTDATQMGQTLAQEMNMILKKKRGY